MNEQVDGQPGVASLVGGIIGDVQNLVRQEMALVKREAADAWDKAKTGATLFGSGVTVLGLAGIFFGFMIAKLLQRHVLPNDEWACFGIVAGIFALVGVCLFTSGRKTLGEVRLPTQTVETLREDAHAVSAAVSGSGHPQAQL